MHLTEERGLFGMVEIDSLEPEAELWRKVDRTCIETRRWIMSTVDDQQWEMAVRVKRE